MVEKDKRHRKRQLPEKEQEMRYLSAKMIMICSPIFTWVIKLVTLFKQWKFLRKHFYDIRTLVLSNPNVPGTASYHNVSVHKVYWEIQQEK